MSAPSLTEMLDVLGWRLCSPVGVFRAWDIAANESAVAYFDDAYQLRDRATESFATLEDAVSAAYHAAIGATVRVERPPLGRRIPLHQAYEGTDTCLHCGKPMPWSPMDECARAPTPDLAAIRARVEAATPGPWTYRDGVESDDSGPYQASPPYVCTDTENITEGVWSHNDAAFIAHAREDIPALLTALDAANARVRESHDAATEVLVKIARAVGGEPEHVAGNIATARVHANFVAIVASAMGVEPGEIRANPGAVVGRLAASARKWRKRAEDAEMAASVPRASLIAIRRYLDAAVQPGPVDVSAEWNALADEDRARLQAWGDRACHAGMETADDAITEVEADRDAATRRAEQAERERDELALTLGNERGEGAPPSRRGPCRPRCEVNDNRRYVVELEPGVWLAPWSGDPGRTLVRESARVYESVHAARTALMYALRYRDFGNAKIVIARGES